MKGYRVGDDDYVETLDEYYAFVKSHVEIINKLYEKYDDQELDTFSIDEDYNFWKREATVEWYEKHFVKALRDVDSDDYEDEEDW